VDLTLLVAEELPCWWATHMPFQHKTFNFFADRTDAVQNDVPLLSRTGPYQTRWMLIDEHTGTHVDAPAHFVPVPGSGLPAAGEQGTVTADRIPLRQLAGPAAVVDVPEDLPGAAPGVSPIIGPDLLEEHERRHGPVDAGTVVLFRTGWDRHYRPGTEGTAYCHDALVTRTGPGWPAPEEPIMNELLDRGVAPDRRPTRADMTATSPTAVERFAGSFLGLPREDRGYLVYLILVALFGWALASYDFNLLVFALPTVSADLGLTSTQTGLLVFIVYAALFVITLFVGYAMDVRGRKWMWVFSLCGAAIFTGLTYFAVNYWSFVVLRALASGLANSELAISITLVNEQVPAARRGLLYSIVQGGWPIGVLIAAGVWLGLNQVLGWHLVFVVGVVPLVFVILARTRVREPDRYLHVKEVKQAKREGDQARMAELLRR
jgi:kynurenine formamidase